MKQEKIYTMAEAAIKTGIPESLLEEWSSEQVISPSVLTDQEESFFNEGDLKQLNQIKHLHEAGYATQEIKKIARKVGLPSPGKSKRKRRIQKYLTVGELAKQSGLNARTIKYWEERGLIAPTTRSDGGFRLFSEATVPVCRLIQDLQLFNYSLEEIKECAELFDEGALEEMKTSELGETQKLDKLAEMTSNIDDLFFRMTEITKGMERWRKLLKSRQSAMAVMRKAIQRKVAQQKKDRAEKKPEKKVEEAE